MKTKYIFLIIFLPFSLVGQTHNSWEGNGLASNSHIRTLNLFVNIIYDDNPLNNPCLSDTLHWKNAFNEGVNNEAIPDYLLDFMDTIYDSNNLHGLFTRLFGESSFDFLQIIGDFVVVNIKESKISYMDNYSFIVNEAIRVININGLATLYGHNSITDYDLKNEGKITCLQVFIRNSYLNKGEGQSGALAFNSIRIGGNYYSAETKTVQGCGGGNDLATNPKTICVHEFSHLLFGHNNFHTSGGNHRANGGHMPFLTLQGGFGLMGAAGSSLVSCNGYERWRMHWKHPNAPDYITAQNMDNTASKISDIRKEDGNKSFLLRDFVTYGDVVRIKLPYKDSEDASNQYIWLENHKVGLNDKLDFFQYSNTHNCRPQGKAGIYAYYQVGRDVLSGSFSEVWFSNERDNLKIIPAEGYWDYSVHVDINNPYNVQCVNWENHTYCHSRETANPFCGYQDQEVQIHPMITDSVMALTQEYAMHRKKIGSDIIDSLAALGDNRDAFSVYSKINMGTNPSTCNAKTYYTFMAKPKWGSTDFSSMTYRNNQTTYLTGLSIEMIPQANNDFMIHICWDDYNIVNDANWTGKIVLKEKANLTNGNNILLTQNLTLAKPYRDTVSGVFASTTVLTCEDGSVFTLEPQSTVSLEQKSKIILKSGSTFVISDDADVFVSVGCVFEIEPCAKLIIKSSGTLYVDDNATLIIHPNAIMQIDEINNIRLPINSNFNTGNGLTFSSVEELLEGLGIPMNFSIDQNVIWNTNKILTHELIVESGATLAIHNNATIFCTSNAKIIVYPGGKLIVDGGILTNICDGESWQGVFVEGNPNDILQSEGNQGVVELKNGAIIENAVCAINVGLQRPDIPHTYMDQGGGIVKAENASFINNLQAVEFAPYHRRKPVGAMFVTKNASYFSHCTFTIDHQALFDLNEFSEHVNLVNVEDVRFQSCNFSSVDNQGTAIRSSLEGSFSLNQGYLLPLARSNITNFDVGICIQDGKPTNIHYTDFDNNNMAVVVEGSEAMYIGGNNFYIPYASYFGPTVGVSLTNCSDFHIRDNLFQGEHNCNYGLIINQSGYNNNVVRNNEFANLHMATVAYGKNSGGYDIATTQHSIGLQYHCNLFENNINDIVVSDFNTEQGSIRFVQGEENDACGNMFTENGVSLSSVNFPLYYFYHNHLHRHQPYQIVGNIETKGVAYHSCGQIGRVDPMISIVDKPASWRQVLEDEYQMLSNELAGVKDFYISHGYANEPIDWSTYFLTVPIPLELEHQVSLFYEICRLESQLSTIISTAFYCIQDEELFDSDLYLEWLERTHTPEADYLRAEYYSEIGDYGECFHVLHTIPAQHAIFDDTEHQNYMDFFTIKMFLNDNLLTWSDLQDYPSEMSILENLAESGVNRLAFKAKSILSTYFGQYQEPIIEPPHLIDLCVYVTYQGNPYNTNSNPNDSSKNDESYKNKLSIQEEDLIQHQDLQLIPNPACHELTLDNGQVAIKEVYIYNLLGKQIKYFNVNNTKTTLNISDLSKGFYFIHIQTHQGVKVKRFVKE